MIGIIPVGNAQKTYKKSLNGIKKVSIEANTRMTVVQGSDNELVLNWSKSKNNDDDYYNNYWTDNKKEKQNDKAKGLTAIYTGGSDNTGFGMQVDQDGEVLRIKDLKPITQQRSFTIIIPKGINLDINTSTLGSVKIDNFTDELEITSNVGSIQLINVTGPITASTSTGNIDVVFTSVNQKAPISLTTATGDIDMSIPSNTKANVEMRSTMGTVYSNFNLVKPRKDGMKNVSGHRKIHGELNSGGVKVYLSSSTGNIYLRKK